MSALRVPSHMHSEDLQPSLWGDSGIATRAARVKTSAQFDETLDVDAPAMITHTTAQYLPSANGLHRISRLGLWPAHSANTAADYAPYSIVFTYGFLNRNIFVFTIRAWTHLQSPTIKQK